MPTYEALHDLVNGATQNSRRETSETHGQTSKSKIERYGWKLLDEPGAFEYIDKSALLIDEDYQRRAKPHAFRDIARAWSWAACGVISVARRETMNYVFDGQQRTLAARLRSDIRTLPCLVFRFADTEGEAGAFLLANTHRKPVTAIEKFKAQLVKGDPAARHVNALIVDAGYEIDPNAKCARTLSCVRCLLDQHARDDGTLDRVWPLIVEVAAGAPIKERVIEALIHIESRLIKRGSTDSLLKPPWRQRVLKLGTAGIVEASLRAQAYHARGGPKIWADGVLQALNSGVRNKLMIEEPSDQAV